ncbi:MAG: hypothetical protein KME08_09625 [Aphanothece sp. CMT-3BRIN-NPC111]|jgi:uncharacterized membrane protein|nr:hypothetical protein [Aphanothece sp. CMT-3BRIN-NPC111]
MATAYLLYSLVFHVNLFNFHPHLTHRCGAKLATAGSESANLSEFEYVWLNLRHPDFGRTPRAVTTLLERLKNASEFQETYQRDDVYLFTKKS